MPAVGRRLLQEGYPSDPVIPAVGCAGTGSLVNVSHYMCPCCQDT